MDEQVAYINGEDWRVSQASNTRSERRTCFQKSANKVHFLYEMMYNDKDTSSRLVARDPRPTKNVKLCEREGSQINMAAKDIPKFLMHTGVLESGCEVHIADGTDFPGYEMRPDNDSRAGRGFRVAGGKVIPTKERPILSSSWMEKTGWYTTFYPAFSWQRLQNHSGQSA